MEAVYEGFKPFKKQLVREIVDADVEKLLQVRIRRISLFDINKHREEMEKTKAELDEARKNLKGLTKYVIGHLEALLEKYGPIYPRLTTKSARHEEVDVKAVAFKSFKVAYDRATGYVGYKVSGDEFNSNVPSSTRCCWCSRTAPTRSANCLRNYSSGRNCFTADCRSVKKFSPAPTRIAMRVI